MAEIVLTDLEAQVLVAIEARGAGHTGFRRIALAGHHLDDVDAVVATLHAAGLVSARRMAAVFGPNGAYWAPGAVTPCGSNWLSAHGFPQGRAAHERARRQSAWHCGLEARRRAVRRWERTLAIHPQSAWSAIGPRAFVASVGRFASGPHTPAVD